jgi:5-methyltetrahydrofolate--homocysteine methyltransferase
MQEQEALAITHDLLASGTAPVELLDSCREAMNRIGKKFECGESFIPELMMAGEILRQISETVKPRLCGEREAVRIGKVVMGTVKGDIHDIAKDIVVFLLDINGFEVFDLGVDVDPQRFVDKVQEVNASIVGLSGFLTLALEPMKQTVSLFVEAGLRKNVRIMIGGGPIDEHARQYTGADAWGKDAMAAVSIARGWTLPENH